MRPWHIGTCVAWRCHLQLRPRRRTETWNWQTAAARREDSDTLLLRPSRWSCTTSSPHHTLEPAAPRSIRNDAAASGFSLGIEPKLQSSANSYNLSSLSLSLSLLSSFVTLLIYFFIANLPAKCESERLWKSVNIWRNHNENLMIILVA